MEDRLCDTALMQLIAALENNRTNEETLKLYKEAIQELESRMYELEAEMDMESENEDY